jgi:hypothetical protein
LFKISSNNNSDVNYIVHVMIRVDIMISSKIKDIRFLRETFLKTSDSFFWKTGEKCLGKSQARGTAL